MTIVTLHAIWVWISANPLTTLAIVLWLIANVVPRPQPAVTQNRWVRLFWSLVDRASILTSDKLPGKLKMLGFATPLPAASTRVTIPDVGEPPAAPPKTPTEKGT